MKERNQPFIEPGENYIIVEKLTSEIIEETIKAFVEENRAYWLKLYHFAGKIDKLYLINYKPNIHNI